MTRNNLAHTLFALGLLAGCGESHDLADTGPAIDAGRDGGSSNCNCCGVIVDRPIEGCDGVCDPFCAPLPDAGPPLDAGSDAGPPVDAGPAAACDPDDAASEPCASLCDGPSRYYWNGDRCFSIDCGACRGDDCGTAGFTSLEECEAAHATCEATLCRSTGGEWQFWSEECGHFVCGVAPPATCESGFPVCDCGPSHSFDPELGCFEDDCPTVDPSTPEELCVGTGGSWEAICCDTECGDFCPLLCAEMACNCGPGRVFEARGCAEASRCFERMQDETCTDDSRCADGTICCQSCGGAGCAPTSTCRVPVCDDDETIDMCGNNLLAP